MKTFLAICILFLGLSLNGQNLKDSVLTLKEFVEIVEEHHPLVKQVQLQIVESEAKIQKARGSFDPKASLDYNTKSMDGLYFDKLNAAVKIPTWFGVDVKGNWEDNTGTYLNPERTVPSNGLYAIGLSLPLAQGLLIDKRRATLKKAKLYRQQSIEESRYLSNKVIFNGVNAYLEWLKQYRIVELYNEAIENAAIRFENVKESFLAGDKPAIDTVEAKIALQNRNLGAQKAALEWVKAGLELSNYLWIGEVPLELEENAVPEENPNFGLDQLIGNEAWFSDSVDWENHPRVRALELKYEGLEVDKRLSQNNLLPEVNLAYQALGTDRDVFAYRPSDNFKYGLEIGIPLFLRKERGALNEVRTKLERVSYQRSFLSQRLKNQFLGAKASILQYQEQVNLVNELVVNYDALLSGEEEKFSAGESSLFLVNSRESKWIDSRLKQIDLENLLYQSKAKMYNVLAL